VSRPFLLLVLAAAVAACGSPRTESRVAATFDPDSLPDAYARPSAALLLPGATRAWQIDEHGDFYDGEVTIRVRPISGSAVAEPPRTIAYEERWLPVAHWWRKNGDVEWRFEAVGFLEAAPRDSHLIASVEVQAVNHGASPREASFELTVGPPPTDPIFVAWDARETPSPPFRIGSGGGDTVYAWTEGARLAPSFTTRWTLPPGGSRTLRLLLPTYPTKASTLRGLAGVGHERRVEDARDHWRAELERGTKFDLHDHDVETALAAARVLLLSCRERRGADWLPIGGPFQYRDVWLRDGARLIAALSVSGHTREARDLAAGFMRFRWPQGAFLSQRGQPDGTGQALWTFEQAMLRPTPSDSLGRYVDAARQAWRWYEWQRSFGRQSGWRFGLMMPYADPHDGELTVAQMVGTDAWALAGYRATSRLMRAAGLDAEADSVERSRARYAADFADALVKSGSRDVPPSWQVRGRDWGNLAVGWPCAALPAGHPRLLALARRVWGEAGEVGLVTYGHRDSLHGYVGADLGTWALLAGRRTEADSVLGALLHWRDATGAAAELFSRAGDFGRNLPPHPTSAAALVALVRNALLYDDGDTLALTLGARALWWRGAHVTGAPTRWGSVDLAFERKGERALWRWTPVPVWTSLTLPPGTVLAGPPPAPLVRRSSTVVLAPPHAREAEVPLAEAPPS
jgi:hypothetical protein